jgi:AcrR family transcriptional regulator
MSIQDILEEVQISSGAFHHYFASRGALLEAFIERIKEASGQPLRQLIANPGLSAHEKLQGLFDTLDRLRTERQAEVVSIGRIWHSESNAVVRLRVTEAIARQRAQLLNEIVRQGVQEGSFTVAYPESTGEVIVALLQAMGDRHAELLFTLDQRRDRDQQLIAEIVTTHALYMDASERTRARKRGRKYGYRSAWTDRVWTGVVSPRRDVCLLAGMGVYRRLYHFHQCS